MFFMLSPNKFPKEFVRKVRRSQRLQLFLWMKQKRKTEATVNLRTGAIERICLGRRGVRWLTPFKSFPERYSRSASSKIHHSTFFNHHSSIQHGAIERIWTSDPSLTKRLLYHWATMARVETRLRLAHPASFHYAGCSRLHRSLLFLKNSLGNFLGEYIFFFLHQSFTQVFFVNY